MFLNIPYAVGMFEAEMSSDSWQLAGMADRGMLPILLGQRWLRVLLVYSCNLSRMPFPIHLQE